MRRLQASGIRRNVEHLARKLLIPFFPHPDRHLFVQEGWRRRNGAALSCLLQTAGSPSGSGGTPGSYRGTYWILFPSKCWALASKSFGLPKNPRNAATEFCALSCSAASNQWVSKGQSYEQKIICFREVITPFLRLSYYILPCLQGTGCPARVCMD